MSAKNKEDNKIRENIYSSFIDSVVYDPEKEKLMVYIDNGSGSEDKLYTYIYKNFGKEKFDDFMDADSKGKYYNSMIKGHSIHEPASINRMIESL